MPQKNVLRFAIKWLSLTLFIFGILLSALYLSADKSELKQNKAISQIKSLVNGEYHNDGWKAHTHKNGFLVQYDRTALWFVQGRTVICLSQKAKLLTPSEPFVPDQIPKLKENVQ